MSASRFAFRFDPLYRAAGLPFAIMPGTAGLMLDEDRLRIRFGLWRLETSLDNIVDARLTGPYGLLKTIGPAHLSLKDRGITFATNGARGVCMTFRTPVSGIDPTGSIRHPAATVTVADCAGLMAALGS